MKPLYKISYMHYGYNLSYTHELENCTFEKLEDGSQKEVYRRFLDCQANLQIKIEAIKDDELKVTKYTAYFYNYSDAPVRIFQFDVGISIESEELKLSYFTSDWGSEFFPYEKQIKNTFSFGSVSGRACKGFIPWTGLITPIYCYSAALAWSGSWLCNIEPQANKYYFSMGHSYPEFYIDIQPGGQFTSAAIYIAKGKDFEETCLEMRRFFRNRLSLLNDISEISLPPIEYNGWWPYEDKFISESVFLENARIANIIGCRYAVMDAGWFGENSDKSGWYEKRGDWELVNKTLFPSGLKDMFDNAKKMEILPGLWCEIEAVGKDAKLNQTHSHIIAKRDGKSLGYVCFGSKKAREWALSVIDKIISEYGAKWIKLDFNLDPAPGCNEKGHGHGEGDGLYAHYIGYYQFLKEIHKKYPDVIIENCSSGGLRMDIEMLSHTHWTHLSDPDYTEFHLQCFWGALSYLHQSACLHFSWSEVLGDHNLGVRNPITEDIEKHKFDFIIRAVMMGVPGFSYKLVDMPKKWLERLKELCSFYEDIYYDFILNGDAYRLTPQPLMGSKGERFPVFQFNSQKGEAIIFAFRLKNAKSEKVVYPKGLDKNIKYDVINIDTNHTYQAYGKELETKGIVFSNIPEESSNVIRIFRK